MSVQLNRREFLGTTAGAAGTTMVRSRTKSEAFSQLWDPDKPAVLNSKELRVQPVLMYGTYEKRQQRSWRPWGGVLTQDAVNEEYRRITGELESMTEDVSVPLKVLPLARVTTAEEAVRARNTDADVMLIYAASGNVLEQCVSPSKANLIFVRHRSGPVYLWYEIVHCRFLRKGSVGFELNNYRYPGGMDVHDVIVDEYGDVVKRLRALHGVKNFIGSRIVALGGGGGWCCPSAPHLAKEKFKIDIIEVPYSDLEKRIKSAKADRRMMEQTDKAANLYLGRGGVSLDTQNAFISNAFALYKIFKDYMKENNTNAFTINECMSTVIPMAETTACLPLSLLNDEGFLAFCESDFNIIPAGILLGYVSGKPVFLNDPTYPHHGVVTCAHCTSPSRMNGSSLEDVSLVTHFESDYGAAPKVEYKKDQVITMIDADCPQEKWVGFKGKIIDSPAYAICRSQCDVKIEGDWKALLEEMRGFHWMMAYGDCLEEMEYAVRKSGLDWISV